MKAMIMAAGVGSRLMPLTAKIPKPMVPIANKPVMEHAINLLKNYNIIEVVANLHYLPNCIKGYFGDGSNFGINLLYSEERKLLGTAGGVKNNQDFLQETFVVLSGDGLTDINLSKLYQYHKKKGALATIALKEVEDVEQFGVVITDDNGRIQSFQEKPKKKEALSNLVNTGIYIFEPEIFNYIPKDTVYDFGKELFPLLIEKGLPFYGYPMEEYWCDIGSLEVYQKAHVEILEGQVKLEGLNHKSKIQLQGQDIKIDPTAKIHGKVIIGNGTVIGPQAELFGNVVIGDNCNIGAGVLIQQAILWDKINVETEAVLSECIVGNEVWLEKGTVVGSGRVVVESSKNKDKTRKPFVVG